MSDLYDKAIEYAVKREAKELNQAARDWMNGYLAALKEVRIIWRSANPSLDLPEFLKPRGLL